VPKADAPGRTPRKGTAMMNDGNSHHATARALVSKIPPAAHARPLPGHAETRPKPLVPTAPVPEMPANTGQSMSLPLFNALRCHTAREKMAPLRKALPTHVPDTPKSQPLSGAPSHRRAGVILRAQALQDWLRVFKRCKMQQGSVQQRIAFEASLEAIPFPLAIFLIIAGRGVQLGRRLPIQAIFLP
jgi:hypothetical protein